ncbi:MAG: hypothetical protein ABII23_09645, partial [bacterium]
LFTHSEGHVRKNSFKILLKQSEKTNEGIRILVDFMVEPSLENGHKFLNLKQYADGYRRMAVEYLCRSFNSHVDREDMLSLSQILDDILYRACMLVEEIVTFKISPDQMLQDMSWTVFHVCNDITACLRSMLCNKEESFDHAVHIKETGMVIKHMSAEACDKLDQTKDMVSSLKMGEMYRHCSYVSERGIEAAYVLSDMLVKLP